MLVLVLNDVDSRFDWREEGSLLRNEEGLGWAVGLEGHFFSSFFLFFFFDLILFNFNIVLSLWMEE